MFRAGISRPICTITNIQEGSEQKCEVNSLTQLAVWEYGIAIGTLVTVFALFAWTIRFVLNTSIKREERGEKREEALLGTLQRVTTEHTESLRQHTAALNEHSQLIQKQSEIISELSTQVSDVTDVIGFLKADLKELKSQFHDAGVIRVFDSQKTAGGEH